MRLSSGVRARLEPWIVKELKDILGPENFDADLTSYVLSLLSGTGTRDHCIEQLRDFLGDAATESFVHALFEKALSEGAAENHDGDAANSAVHVGADSPITESRRRARSEDEEEYQEADDEKHWRRRVSKDTESDRSAKESASDDAFKRRRFVDEDGKVGLSESSSSLSSSRDWDEGQSSFRRKDGAGRWPKPNQNQWPVGAPMWPQVGYGNSGQMPFPGPYPYVAPMFPMGGPGAMVFASGPGFVPPPPPNPAPGAAPHQPPLPPGRPPVPAAPQGEAMKGMPGGYSSTSPRPSHAPDSQHPAQSLGHTPSAADREAAIQSAKTYAFPGGGMRLIEAEGFYSPPEDSESTQEPTTILCTGVPHFVKEMALFQHFKQFGIVVALRILRFPFTAPGPETEAHHEKKVYNEAYIQYATAAQAQKCVNSPKSVLDNRFIKVFISNLSIIDPAKAAAVSAPRGSDAAKEFRQRDVQRKYEDLKRLRQQEDIILNKKQELLEGQIVQCKKMAAKLNEAGGDSEKNARMCEELESKILTLQSKLREIKEKREAMEAEFQQNAAGLMEDSDAPVGELTAGEHDDGAVGGPAGMAAALSMSSGVARYSRAAARGRGGGRSGRGRGRGGGEPQRGGRGSGVSAAESETAADPAAEAPEGVDGQSTA